MPKKKISPYHEKYPPITDEQRQQIESLLNLTDFGSMFADEKVKITSSEKGYLIEISRMYDYVSFKEGVSLLRGMHQICEILNCTEGDENSRYHSDGCPTCDYGSKYVVAWRFWR